MALLTGAPNFKDDLSLKSACSKRERISIARAANPVGWILCTLFICCLGFTGLSARGQIAQEYDLKAAFLCKFPLFVKWPTNAFPDPETPITIGVLGKDPFGENFYHIVRKESVQKRNLVVEKFGAVEEVIKRADEGGKTCHILFVSKSESGKMTRILTVLKGRHILTVGESDSFCQNGGIIQFVIVEDKVRFIVNQDAAKVADLKLSATLLDLAEKNRKK